MNQAKKKRFYNPTKYMGLGALSRFHHTLKSSAKAMFTPAHSQVNETFAEAVARLELSEEDIQRRTQQFLKVALSFAVFALLVFIYTIILFWNRHIQAGIIGMAVTLVITTQVFRYHFWYFQMKKRKLNCTFKDWLQS